MGDLSGGNRLIFVGGAPRSGTTLVQNMLDSHPDICGGPEFLHVPEFINLRRNLHRSISIGHIDLFCSYDDVDRHIIALIENLLLPLADKQGCEFLSEKTPENVLVFSDLIELFPDAHFIHVIRDPRAIISSMQQVGRRAKDKGFKPPAFSANISASIAYVRKCFDAGLNASKNAPDKVLTVVYERLVKYPEREIKKICNFLGVEWTKQMMYPGNKKHLGENAITTNSNEIWYDVKTYYRNPDSKSTDKWKSNLKLSHQVRIVTAFKDYEELKQFRYCFSKDGLPQAKRLLWTNCVLFYRIKGGLHKYVSALTRRIPFVNRIRRALLLIVRS